MLKIFARRVSGVFLGLVATTSSPNAETIVLTHSDYRVETAQKISHLGKVFELANILAPEPGQMCMLRGHQRDCGIIARSQLLDLTAAATLKCTIVANNAVCSSGGFDIAAQMVYTGWAVPSADAPAKYFELMKGAQSKSRGLWRARFTKPWAPLLDSASIKH